LFNSCATPASTSDRHLFALQQLFLRLRKSSYARQVSSQPDFFDGGRQLPVTATIMFSSLLL
jgi:hypothetical protein